MPARTALVETRPALMGVFNKKEWSCWNIRSSERFEASW